MVLLKSEKPRVVKELVELINSHKIVALIDIHKLPAKQMQSLKALVPGKVKVSRKTLIRRAIEESGKPGLDKLLEYPAVQPALLFSNDNPFRLATFLEKNKSPAAAKEGDIAPKDIVIQAGPTQFPPGPTISTLNKVGLKTSVQNGKIHIDKDKVVAKKGDVITPELVAVFNLLGIEPMEIGLNIVAVWENGSVLPGDVLVIDEKEYFDRIVAAAKAALNLSVEISYPTKESIELIIAKAVRQARSLVTEEGLPVPEMMGDVISSAHQKAVAVKKEANV